MADFICGLDEAGRGPLAGPVSAAAVILPLDFPLEFLNDSKKLSEKKREIAEKVIKEKALWAVSFVNAEEIDRINILNASLKAMRLAFESLSEKLSPWLKANGFLNDNFSLRVIADGNKTPPIEGFAVECMVKADAKIPSVMAASIIAKVERDRLMCSMDKLYPEYGYAKHKGYPTKEHREICRRLGPSPIQRMSFKY